MTASTILIVDDDVSFLASLTTYLKLRKLNVLGATTGPEGLELIRTHRPDFVILDVDLGKNQPDGFQLCAEIRSWKEPELKSVPVLILTHRGESQDHHDALQKYGADDFLTKPVDPSIVFAHIDKQLSKTNPPPFSQGPATVLGLTVSHEHPVHVTVSHAMQFVGVTSDRLNLDPTPWGQLAGQLSPTAWRGRAKTDGRRIWEALMRHPELSAKYHELVGGDPASLKLRFPGPRDFLRVPLEFAFDSVRGAYLVLTHPVSRSIVDAPRNTPPMSAELLNRLWAERRPLRVLLIGSNTWSEGRLAAIPTVDREINLLSTGLPDWFRNHTKGRLDVDITTLSGASAKRVEERLRNGRFDLVHYAGHAVQDIKHPEESSLIFWENEPDGKLAFIRARQLRMWLEHSTVAFMYLSTCEGAASAQRDVLFEEDFLGVADAIVKAGVPALLGFRWPISDDAALELCADFYRSLAAQGDLDTALCSARRDAYGRNAEDPTWLSAILIIQG